MTKKQLLETRTVAKEIREKSVGEVLNLPLRTLRVLSENKTITIEDLLNQSEKSLFHFIGLGKKGITRVVKELKKKLGVKLPP